MLAPDATTVAMLVHAGGSAYVGARVEVGAGGGSWSACWGCSEDFLAASCLSVYLSVATAATSWCDKSGRVVAVIVWVHICAAVSRVL